MLCVNIMGGITKRFVEGIQVSSSNLEQEKNKCLFTQNVFLSNEIKSQERAPRMAFTHPSEYQISQQGQKNTYF